MLVRHTRLDGTPCTGAERHLHAALVEQFTHHGVTPDAFAAMEHAVIQQLHPRIRAAVRARTRLDILTREIAAWTRLKHQRPSWFAPDARGRYAWARRALTHDVRTAMPTRKRHHPLQLRILAVVTEAILRQLDSHWQPGRDVDRGVNTTVDRLAVSFVQFHFPTLCAGVTPDRVRRRPGLARRRPRPA